MLKYIATALALKAFSLNNTTSRAYRWLGNNLGTKRRISNIRAGGQSLVTIGTRLVNLGREHHAIKDGDHLLEIGTGWMHQWALFVRLLYDIQMTLFDVWDNRQLAALQQRFKRLQQPQYLEQIKHELELDAARSERMHELLQDILTVESFEELYALLNSSYLTDSNGSLDGLEESSFDVILSVNVLEHIGRDILYRTVHDYYRLLKPGGYCLHQIDLNDHLAHHDVGVHPKQYLYYSDRAWKLFFENDMQYINRLQRPEWLALFEEAGFVVDAQRTPDFVDVERAKVSGEYLDLDQQDLECQTLILALRKP